MQKEGKKARVDSDREGKESQDGGGECMEDLE
jgi:hypothetical protein